MTEEDIAAFRNAARALAGAEKTVMTEVGKNMRAVAKPIVNKVRAEVRSSKGTSERGVHASEVERQLHVLSKARQNRATGHYTERQVRSVARRIQKMSSLREAIAAAAGSSVSASEKKVALSFRVRAGQLPPSQRKLPRRWDNPSGWKHPVFGNRKVWVKQIGHPYFRTTISGSKDQVTASVVSAMTVAAEKIVHPEGEAA